MGEIVVAAWRVDAVTQNVFWGVSLDGGRQWANRGLLPRRQSFESVVGFPSVCADSTGLFTIAALYGASTGRSIAIYRASASPDQSALSLSGPTFAIPFLPSAQGRPTLPRIACDPSNGTLYLSYSVVSGFNADVHLVTFVDGAWTEPVLLGSGVCLWPRPVVGPDGEVYVFWQDATSDRMVGRRSGDSGATFGPEFTVGSFLENLTKPPAYFYDGSDWMDPSVECRGDDLPPNFPSVDIDRSLGAHRGKIYAVWTERVSGSLSPVLSSFGESEPNGTPATGNRVELGQQFTGTTVSPDLIGSPDQDVFYFDGVGGQTIWFEGEVTGFSRQGLPMSGEYCQHLSLFRGSAGVDLGPATTSGEISRMAPPAPFILTLPSNGRYMTCLKSIGPYSVSYRMRLRTLIPDGSGVARDHRDVVLTTSIDGGQTWTPKILVNDDPPWFDNFLPELAVDGIGGVHVTWYDRRDDPEEGVDSNVYWSYSADGGLSFRPSLRLSDTTSVRDDANLELGDYMGLTSHATGAQAVWTQARLQRLTQGGPGVDHDIHTRRVDVVPDIVVRGVTGSSEVATHSSGPRRLRLEWSVADPGFVHTYRVHRALEAGGMYDVIGVVDGGGNGLFMHDGVRPNEVLYYRVDAIRTDGLVVTGTPVEVRVPGRPVLTLRSATPNPSRGPLSLEIDSTMEGTLEIRIFDARGAAVRSLYLGEVSSGVSRFEWDGRNDAGRPVTNGIYFIEATMGKEQTRSKVIRSGS